MAAYPISGAGIPGAIGTRLHEPLMLGATSGLTFWPLATALTIVVIEVAVRWRAPRRPEPPARNPRPPLTPAANLCTFCCAHRRK